MGKPITLWWIDDSKSSYEAYALNICDKYDGIRLTYFESAFEASQHEGRPDYIVVDLSAVGGMMVDAHRAYGPICSLCELHPGSIIIINSAVQREFAMDVYDRVKEHVDNCVEIAAWMEITGVEEIIDRYEANGRQVG